MGWQSDKAGSEHEGWCVGLTPREGTLDGWRCEGCDWRGEKHVGEHPRRGRRHKDQPKGRTCTARVVPVEGALLRELSYPTDETSHPLSWIQAGCECGWRSPRWRAVPWWHVWKRPDGRTVPKDTIPNVTGGDYLHTERPSWFPYVCMVDDRDEELVHFLWKEHIDALDHTHAPDVRRHELAERERRGLAALGARV